MNIDILHQFQILITRNLKLEMNKSIHQQENKLNVPGK